MMFPEWTLDNDTSSLDNDISSFDIMMFPEWRNVFPEWTLDNDVSRMDKDSSRMDNDVLGMELRVNKS